ncbi:MAG: LacI family DNA-binding transcriptional regulator [Opitutaceae bacterium]|nr:LacI family DNA-binding transcriptional regulator [Opitutaceae bacterium]
MKRESPLVTMAELGRRAGGYHQSTVSLALRDRPGVSPTVRSLIKKAARKFGYRRDPLLDAFNLHRVKGLPRRALEEIAFVAGFATKAGMEASPQHMALWRGADAAARMAHCRLEFFPLVPGGMTARRLDAVLHARGIEAMILAEFEDADETPQFTWDRFCAVRVGCAHFDAPGHLVVGDLLHGTRNAVRRMRALGYRRIGLVTTEVRGRLRSDDARAGVLYEQMRSAADERVTPLALTEVTTRQAMKDWLRVQRVDALLADTDAYRRVGTLLGVGGLRGLGRAWLDVTAAPAGAAGIVVDHEALAVQAIEQIAVLRRLGKCGLPGEVAVMQVPVGWRDGATLPPRKTKERAAVNRR